MLMRTRKRPALDAHDRAILGILQHDGRISLTRLASQIGLSATPCAGRLRRLERAGVIRRYGAIVDPRQLGRCMWTRVEVTLGEHRGADFARFETAIRDVPEIIECDALGGGIDYLVTVVTRDIDHYRQLMDTLLARDLGIAGCRGYVVTKRIKESAGLPLDVIAT